MPTRKTTATKKIRGLDGLPVDGMFWELILGPRSCDETRCMRAGHHLPRRFGSPVADPERPVGTVIYPTKNGEDRVEPHALCSEWAAVEERREVYWACREELLEMNDGTRPWAYWAIEIGEHPKDEALYLAEHGLLSPAEEGHICAWSDHQESQRSQFGELIGGTNRYKTAADVIRARRGIPVETG